jgi:hypothetical protein
MPEAAMTTDELRSLLEACGWSQLDLARYAQRDPSKTRKQARGALPIDAPLAEWLRRVADVLRHPPVRRTADADGNHVSAVG